MARRDLHNVRAFITGTSSGIGRALVEALLPYQPRIVAVARRADRLAELAEKGRSFGAEIFPFACDLSDPVARQEAVNFAAGKLEAIDLLVNNAGTGALGRFEDTPPEILRQVMELNFFAPVEITYFALPLLKKGRRPIIVNVSSILGHRGIPWRAYYCASKFALHGFSESIRAELTRHGIDVLIVSPGRTRTELFDGPLEKGKEPAWPEPAPVSPEYVARCMVRAIKKGKAEIIPHTWGKGMVLLSRLAPRLMDWILKRYA
ncbi:MAG: SDR family NAD(P)-dependent oxidoreductase [Thermogutta sp.]|uniref:SDR family NAD(P)-dependent oxidoreductase n=1 Tax=Thermogutta sp. TaxID=1962930 RepID=UPI0019A3279B|nr:SDR family NAD(P)-dependent oxidoreductase [Thermogutta sp.]MBC7354141.1 SDR family NAD(P)-dependent oxidoreductase [Thermogutta sp.]